MDKKLIHICEVCGKTEILTPEEAFNEGWDYPPRMGDFGIVLFSTLNDAPFFTLNGMELFQHRIKNRCHFI